MKLINSNFKKGFAKIKIENLDDIWCLSQIIDQGDLVTSRTLRKIKLGEKEERAQKKILKPATIKIKVEKIEFHKTLNSLRISGKIKQAPEDIQKDSYHTLNIEENSILKIEKIFPQYQIKKIKQASEEKQLKVLIIAFDRDAASFAVLKKYGYDYLGDIRGQVAKKRVKEKIQNNFYKQTIKTIKEYVKKYEIEHIILASPAFWKEELLNQIEEKELKSKITLATCNSTGKNGINEILKRAEVIKVLKQDRTIQETNLVERLLLNISKNKLSVYGLKEVEEASNMGAVELLLVTDSLIHKLRDKNKFQKLEKIMKTIESNKGEVHIISSAHNSGKKLEGISGIAAILRYEIK